MSVGRGWVVGGASRPGAGGDGGELRFSHCSGVFSDGNFTYIVEPREMAGPWENAQVSPSPLVVPVAVISVAAAASFLPHPPPPW